MPGRLKGSKEQLNGGSRPSRLPLRLRAISRGARLAARVGAIALASVWVTLATHAAVAFAATFHVASAAALQAAVASANASGGPSTIELSGGVLQPTSTLVIRRTIAIVGSPSTPGSVLAGAAVAPFPSDLFLVEAHAALSVRDVELTAGGGEGTTAAIDDFGSVQLEYSTVAGNAGPGVLVQPGADAVVRNSTISYGRAFGLVNDGTARLSNSTVAYNAGGGLENRGTLSLADTIVAANKGSGDCEGVATASSHSLDSDGSCHVGALSRTDPRRGRLAENGGPTATEALEAGSPAIDAGAVSACPAVDQRHFDRPTGHCDIGAYQTGARAPSAPRDPSGPGSGSGSPPRAAAGKVVGLVAHGNLHDARGRRIWFGVRALFGHAGADLTYRDTRRHVVLGRLAVRSLSIDAVRGKATLHGSVLVVGASPRVGITLVLESRSGISRVRIRLSTGYRELGYLRGGSITFLRGTPA